MLTVGDDGGIVFKDRHHRLLDSASITSQATWTGVEGSFGPVMSKPFIYDDAWRNIINHGLVSVDVRMPQNLRGGVGNRVSGHVYGQPNPNLYRYRIRSVHQRCHPSVRY